jgi:hypothetical protein
MDYALPSVAWGQLKCGKAIANYFGFLPNCNAMLFQARTTQLKRESNCNEKKFQTYTPRLPGLICICNLRLINAVIAQVDGFKPSMEKEIDGHSVQEASTVVRQAVHRSGRPSGKGRLQVRSRHQLRKVQMMITPTSATWDGLDWTTRGVWGRPAPGRRRPEFVVDGLPRVVDGLNLLWTACPRSSYRRPDFVMDGLPRVVDGLNLFWTACPGSSTA